MFKNTKLSTKLIGGFGIVLALLMAVMGIYQYAVSSTTTNFQGLMHAEIAIANHAGKAETLMLQSRRNEKDFLLRLDKKYVDKLEKNVTALKNEVQAIGELARQSGDQEAASKALAITGYAEDYTNAFNGVVTSREKRGLDHNSGLQGRFRDAAHALAETMPAHAVDDLRIALLQMRRYEKDYLRTESDKYKQKFTASIETYARLLKNSGCDAAVKNAQEMALASYRKAFDSYLAAGESSDLQPQSYQTMRAAAHKMEEALDGVYVPEARALLLDIRKNEKDYLLRGDEKYIKKTHAAIEKLLNAFKGAGILQKHIADAEKALSTYKEAFDKLVAEDRKITALTAAMRAAVHQIEPEVEDLYRTSTEAAAAKTRSTVDAANLNARIAITVGIAGIILGLCLAFFLTRSITKPINRIIEGLSEGAYQVASASNQVSSASQSLAEGASEQAASIEETSSSLEEMSSMTKQNADNASQADTLMKESNQVVSTANGSMTQLTTSMVEITQASEETSKIIKTIDEIAFQTNLLALNAAVEAARAGEAGAGFAVVADEVRNLALRAADAAKNTAGLIEGTVQKVQRGSELVNTTNDAFCEVAASSAKVGGLVGEISAASNEQSQGIEQVNRAVAEMDKVTQQNAANAEESASASEEMSAQAEQMKEFVDDLVIMVSGRRDNGLKKGPRKISRTPLSGAVQQAVPAKSVKDHKLPGNEPVAAEQLIPLEEDFREF